MRPFPATCPGCGREGAPICGACLPALDARLDQPPGVLIGMPVDLPYPLLQLEWCAPFVGVVRDALHAIKYQGERRLAEPLGAPWPGAGRRPAPAATSSCPVPVHAARARQRGYDQAQLIAEVAARHLALPHARLPRAPVETIAQFELDRRERATNVRGAFRLASTPGARAARGPLGRPRGRRHDDGRDPVRLCDGAHGGGRDGVSAITVARER